MAMLSPTSALKDKVLQEWWAWKDICAGHDGNLNLPLSKDVQWMQS